MGPPGVGKGTQANIIKDKYDIPHLSTGEILRNEIELESAIGVIAKKYIDDGVAAKFCWTLLAKPQM